MFFLVKKSKKSLKKKVVRNFLKKNKFDFFSRFFQQMSSKLFQRDTKQLRKNIEQFFRNMFFFVKKSKKSSKKKSCSNFFDKFKIFYFFEFFSKNVLKTLLGGKETIRKKYRIAFEIFWKHMVFLDFACPSTRPWPIHHSSIRQ